MQQLGSHLDCLAKACMYASPFNALASTQRQRPEKYFHFRAIMHMHKKKSQGLLVLCAL
jgi:hypothetical protein